MFLEVKRRPKRPLATRIRLSALTETNFKGVCGTWTSGSGPKDKAPPISSNVQVLLRGEQQQFNPELLSSLLIQHQI